jgi:hypothetical protein
MAFVSNTCGRKTGHFSRNLGIPAKSISDSELKPINDSGVKSIAIGAKRRWRDDSGRSDRHRSTEIIMSNEFVVGAVGMWKSQ